MWSLLAASFFWPGVWDGLGLKACVRGNYGDFCGGVWLRWVMRGRGIEGTGDGGRGTGC